MRIITISREFGSGGRELGKRLADALGYDYYDNEIISQIAKNLGLDEDYIENTLSNHNWQDFTLTYNETIGSSYYDQMDKVNLLIEQKNVIEKIATLGKNFVIVGRNADIILEKYEPFNIFVCASMESKIKRCLERKNKDKSYTKKVLEQKIKKIDKNRSRTRQLMSDLTWGNPQNYHLTVNTSNIRIASLIPAVSSYVNNWFSEKEKSTENNQ